MILPSWLSTCSSATCTATADDTSPPPPKLFYSDSSSASDAPLSSSLPSSYQGTSYSSSSLQSNLSLQTLPSVPSLQKVLSPAETLNLHVTHLHLASLKPPFPAQITALALHRSLVYAAFGHEINVFHTTNFDKIVDVFNRHGSHSGSVKSITFRDEKVFSAHQDGKIRVWAVTVGKKHKFIATLPTVKDILRRFAFPKNYIKVRRHKKRLWIEHHDAVSGLAITDNLLCSVSWDRSLKIWRASDFQCLDSLRAHEDAINAVAVGLEGTIYTASADRRIKVWGPAIGERNRTYKYVLIATLEKHKSAVNALALNSDGSVLFSGACDRSILVWEREDSANHMVVSGALRGHSKAILCLINVCDFLFSGSADRTVRIWQRGYDGQYCCLSVLDGHDKPVKALAAVKEDESDGGGGLKVLSGSFDGEIKVWQVLGSNPSNAPL